MPWIAIIGGHIEPPELERDYRHTKQYHTFRSPQQGSMRSGRGLRTFQPAKDLYLGTGPQRT